MRPANIKQTDSPNIPVFPTSAMGPNINSKVSLLRNINSVESISSLWMRMLLLKIGLLDTANLYLGDMMDARVLPNMVVERQFNIGAGYDDEMGCALGSFGMLAVDGGDVR